MADILDVYKPEFWAQETLLQLWPRLTMTGLVYRDFDNVVANSGDTVNTRITEKFAADDVNPDNFASQKPKARNVAVKMDKWKGITFEIGDKDDSMTIKRVYEEFLPNAGEAMAEDVETSLMGLYGDLYNRLGAPGTALNDVAKIGTDVRQKFNELMIPRTGRYVGLSAQADNYFNQVFYQAYVSGDASQQNTGELRDKFGQTYFYADMLPDHTAGTAAGAAAAKINAAVAYSSTAHDAGQQAVVIKGITQGLTLVPGDLITIKGNPHVIVTGATADAGTLAPVTIAPEVPASGYAVDDPVVITASHKNCLAFHSQCFALVSRPLRTPGFPGAAVSVMNYNGIGVRAAVWYSGKDKRSYVSLDMLYGVKTLDARKGFRIIY
jgi:hypothetical protein